MIKIKAWYGDWKESTKEQAIELAKHIYLKSNTKQDKAIEAINCNHLKGLTVTKEDLM